MIVLARSLAIRDEIAPPDDLSISEVSLPSGLNLVMAPVEDET